MAVAGLISQRAVYVDVCRAVSLCTRSAGAVRVHGSCALLCGASPPPHHIMLSMSADARPEVQAASSCRGPGGSLLPRSTQAARCCGMK